MGLRKERQLLRSAIGFAALAAVFARFYFNDEPSWTNTCLIGPLSIFFLLASVICLDMRRMKPADSHTVESILMQYFSIRLVMIIFLPIMRRRLKKETMDPKKVSEDSLLRILRENQNTQYGQEYKFSEMKTREDFVRGHPITTEDHYTGYVKRIMDGEQNVLFPGKIYGLISTSGTTGKSKVYAFAERYIQLFMKRGMIFIYSVIPLWNLQRIAGFHIHSKIKTTESGIRIGALSQFLFRSMLSIIPEAYSKLYREDASFYAQALFSLADRELGIINGFSADLMLSYWKFIVENWDHLCEDISNGYIGKHIDMPADVKKALSDCLEADPERAAELREAIKDGVVGLARRIWPGMLYLQLGKSAAFKMCADILMENHFKGIKVIGIVHGATESFTGVNLEGENAHIGEVLTLQIAPSYVEFICIEDVEQEHPEAVSIEKLEVGGLYEVVHTTNNGLYRCRYGDVIKIVGFYNNTPKYEFQYRLGQRLNIAYERTPDKILFEAIKACEQYNPSGASLVNYTTTESIALENLTGSLGKGHYVFFMEFDTDAALNCTKLANEIDTTLVKLHEQYKRFKDIDSIGTLRIIQVKGGTFEKLKDYIWNNNPHSQFKMPRVLRRELALEFLMQQEIKI